MTALTPAGTVRCILCYGTVSYKSQNSKKFESHMKNEHDAYFNLEFMLTACLMNPDERDSVKDLIGKQHEEQTSLDISPHDLPPTPTSLPEDNQEDRLQPREELLRHQVKLQDQRDLKLKQMLL